MRILIASLALAAALAGCASYPGDVRPYPSIAPVGYAASPYGQAAGAPAAAASGSYLAQPVAPVSQANPGGIWREGPGLRLFSDSKARDIGDLLTIELTEKTNATSTANTAVSKSSGVSLSAPSVFGAPLTMNGRDLLSADIEGGRDFSGTGDSRQSNSLSGSITVTVVDRLPNGNLVVQGSKQMRLNQGDELVQIQGVIRPVDIASDNSVPSSRVGEARIVYGGRGTLARSNAMGWLAQFFNSPVTPF